MNHTLKQGLLALPGIGVSLLPKVACPLCWPAYAGLLGSTGLGFLLSSTHLLSLTAAFLVIALAALGYRARERRGYGPLTVGLAASVAVLTCKFVIEFSAGTYVGIGLLVLASLWNTWPPRGDVPAMLHGLRKISQHIQVKENRNGESKA